VDVLWERMYSTMRLRGHSTGFMTEAISGVDIALWDILGKALDLPVYMLLGGAFRDRIKAYASGVPGATIEEQVAHAKSFVQDRGFTAVKMSTGRKNLEVEIQAVAALSKAIGDQAHLLVDAHGAYDAYTAINLGRQMQDLGVYWLEDPLPPEDHSGYKMLSDALDMAIAAGETECNRYQFRDRLADRSVDILLPDVCRAGGISECRKIAMLADCYNTPWAAHVSMGSPIHIAASLHLGAATPNFLICECPTHQNPIGNNLLKAPLVCADGFFELPDGPGLGIELDEQALAKVILEGDQ
jgi:D-galactarolactone cycloisomerase